MPVHLKTLVYNSLFLFFFFFFTTPASLTFFGLQEWDNRRVGRVLESCQLNDYLPVLLWLVCEALAQSQEAAFSILIFCPRSFVNAPVYKQASVGLNNLNSGTFFETSFE